MLLLIGINTRESMMRALAILTVLPLVVTTPALSQNAQSTQPQPTSPNSGAGIPGQPGNKSGPAVKPPSATTGSGVDAGVGRNQDAAKVPGLPGSKSGPAVRPPSSTSPASK
jgi:hypothetical protein